MNGSTSTVFDDDEEENLASAPSAASHAHLDVSAILSSPLLRLSVRPPTTYLLRSIKRDEAMQPARTRSKEGGSQPAREVNVDNKDTKKSDFKERVSLPSFHSLESGHMYFCFLGTSQYAILRAVPNRPSFRPSRPSVKNYAAPPLSRCKSFQASSARRPRGREKVQFSSHSDRPSPLGGNSIEKKLA